MSVLGSNSGYTSFSGWGSGWLVPTRQCCTSPIMPYLRSSILVWHLNLDWWSQCTVESPDYLAKTESHDNHAGWEASHTPSCLWWNNHQTGPRYYFRAHPRPSWVPSFSSLKSPSAGSLALKTNFVSPVHQSSKWQVGLSLTPVMLLCLPHNCTAHKYTLWWLYVDEAALVFPHILSTPLWWLQQCCTMGNVCM